MSVKHSSQARASCCISSETALLANFKEQYGWTKYTVGDGKETVDLGRDKTPCGQINEH